MEHWLGPTEDSEKFVPYLDNLTGWYLLNFCQVRQCEFSPAMCMKCEAFYRKPHNVSKTDNAISNGSTVPGTVSYQVLYCARYCIVTGTVLYQVLYLPGTAVNLHIL